jgi:murein DD-endopeptidase MepM/ murein hydrolase activator NlpD
MVSKGQLIASVGPKNVYGIANNPYKDANGNPTNGATTGCHLHLGVRINNEYINPLSFFPGME